MRLLLENWNSFLLLENAALGSWGGPQGSGDRIVYPLTINDQVYEVVFRKKSHGAPFDISFNTPDAEGYEMTGKQEVFSILNSIVGILKDFIEDHPEEKTFKFTGAETSAGEGGTEQTKRTKVFNKFIERAISRDGELASQIAKISDLSHYGAPNTIFIKLLGWDEE
jgi:hypothetical protein